MAAASQRQLLRRAAMIGLLMRHSVNAGVAAIGLLDPNRGVHGAGYPILIGLLAWSGYRLLTRSGRVPLTMLDFAVIVAVCLAIPVLTTNPAFYLTNSAPQAIAGTAVISFAVTVPLSASLPMTVTIAAAYAFGLAAVIGWERVPSVLAIYYFGLQWVTSGLIRLMLLRVAAAVDRAREVRESAHAARQIDEAVRTFEREQLALLHDTVASTLLIVGHGVEVAPARLAAQARRDLEILLAGPWRPAAQRIELVATLRDALTLVRTPGGMSGLDVLWLDGDVGQAVVSSTREALNNVDRHAGAKRIHVDVAPDRVTVSDDGVGFDPADVQRGLGIAESMTARMRRVRGSATVTSRRAAGTSVELRWPTDEAPPPTVPVTADPDRLIERIRAIYTSAIAVYAVVNLIATVPYSVVHTGAALHVALAAAAGLGPVLVVGALRRGTRAPVWTCLGVLLAVTAIQPALLPPDQIGTQADWVQGGIGWCVLALVLAMPVPRAAATLIGFWLVEGIVELVLHPAVPSLVNIGLGTGSILGVQLFALAFDGLMRDAERDVHAAVESHKTLVIGARVARAVAEEYGRRYAALVDDVIPLLQELRDGVVIDAAMQRRARAHSRQLRALFGQSRSFEHPLARRLRAVIDVAESHRTDVVVDVGAELPDVTDDVVEYLVAPLRTMLDAEVASAHVVVTSSGDTLSVSVVGREARDPESLADLLAGSVATEVITLNDTVWLIVEHTLVRDPQAGYRPD